MPYESDYSEDGSKVNLSTTDVMNVKSYHSSISTDGRHATIGCSVATSNINANVDDARDGHEYEYESDAATYWEYATDEPDADADVDNGSNVLSDAGEHDATSTDGHDATDATGSSTSDVHVAGLDANDVTITTWRCDALEQHDHDASYGWDRW